MMLLLGSETTMQNQSYIKPERVDSSYYPLIFQPPQHGVQQPTAPRPQQAVNSHGAKNSAPAQKNSTPAPTENTDTNIEDLPDFPSIKGVFGWTTVDDVNVPYILRSDKHYVSVRIVEMKLLSRYPNSYPDDLGKHAPLTSFFITDNESKLLNEINIKHCDCEYGKKEFTTKDLIVLLSDFIRFYELVKKTFPDPKADQQKAGWLQIKNTVTPFLNRGDGKYVPLSVIQYAAGLLTNEKITSVSPSKGECDVLNHACKQAGVEFTFSEANRLIKIKDLLRINPVEIIALPSSNPLKHATYMELPTKNNVPNADSKPSQPASQKTQQPYRFQPNSQLELLNRLQQGQVKRTGSEHSERAAREQHERAAREHSERSREHMEKAKREQAERAKREHAEKAKREHAERIKRELAEKAREQHVAFPPHLSNMQGVPMFDPRFAAMYRHPLSMPPNSQSGIQGHMLDPFTQYFVSLQQGMQNQAAQGPPNQQAPPGGVIPGRDVHNKSPGSSSSTNPSPRSRPPSQSRPPSGSRPPSQPSASPLSPAQLLGRNDNFGVPTGVPLPPHPNQLPPPYPGLNLHQIQAMFQQRYPLPFPPNSHKQPVSPKQTSNNDVVNISVEPPSSVSYGNPTNIVNGHHTSTPRVASTNAPNIPQYPQPSTHQRTRHTSGNSTKPSKPDSQKSPGHVTGGPPPLILMMPNSQSSSAPKNGLIDSLHVTAPPHPDQLSAVVGSTQAVSNTNISPAGPKAVTITPDSIIPVHPQPGTLPSPNSANGNATTPVYPQAVTASAPKQKSPYVDRIQGAWLNNKSISCLHLEGADRQGGYCLVEAVCKLYFNGCSVTEFLFALEKVLNVTLLTCNADEEKAFIQYYNLPVDVLKCNKMIKFEDLETFFPQLSYMFPDKNTQDLVLGQEAGDVLEADNNNMDKFVTNGVTPEELVNSMPMTMSEMGVKRNSDLFDVDVTRKKLRLDDNEDDAVIILD